MTIEKNNISALTKPILMLWWNTSLSPLGNPRNNSLDQEYAYNYLANLVETLNIDLIGLGEVCTADIEEILKRIGKGNFQLHDATTKVGRNSFDIGVIFNRDRLALTDTGKVLDSFGKTTLKVGEKLAFQNKESGKDIFLFVSHWPSRLHLSESESKRIEMGGSLRRALDELKQTSLDERYIVLMGDFNDDPFSPSIYKHLLATRDRELVIKNDSFTYNPFWRSLGESHAFEDSWINGICGTYYYSSGEQSRWFNFDQILFSSAFLKNGPLSLNESKCFILHDENLVSKLKNSKDNFDHLPVIGAIDIGDNQL